MTRIGPGDTPPALPRLPALDALRALGAAAVVATHVGFATGATASPAWGGLLARMDVGVAIFFVLSGFLLFRPYAHAAAHGLPRPGPGRYLWRRALRILPAYWLTVLVCLALLPGNAGTPRGDWLRFATLTQIYQPGHLREALGHTWSLATEVVFYLLLPVVAGAVLGRGRRPGRVVAVLCAGGTVITGGWLAAMAAGRLDMGLHTMWLPAFATWFAAGMALATAHVAVSTADTAPARAGRWGLLVEAGRAPLTCWLLAAGLFVIASTPLTGPRDLAEPTPAQFGVRMVLFLGVAVAIVAPAAFAAPGPVRSALSSPVARWLGTVSYGLFLWHPFVLTLLVPSPGNGIGGLAGTYLLTVAGALLLASLSWYLLEKPVQLLGRTRRSRATARVAPDNNTTDNGAADNSAAARPEPEPAANRRAGGG
jgi:peptidoglycan/LPS O-acetylase OafA/YrhL